MKLLAVVTVSLNTTMSFAAADIALNASVDQGASFSGVPSMQAANDHRARARRLLDTGDMVGAISEFTAAVAMYDRIGAPDDAADAMTWLGWTLGRSAQYQAAIDAFQDAADRWHKLGVADKQILALNNQAKQYEALKQWDAAIRVYQQVLPLVADLKNATGEGITLDNIASAYQDLEQFEQALAYRNRALTALRTAAGPETLSLALRNTHAPKSRSSRGDDSCARRARACGRRWC
jgi:tetratricopeptide (TPR) repeat protein